MGSSVKLKLTASFTLAFVALSLLLIVFIGSREVWRYFRLEALLREAAFVDTGAQGQKVLYREHFAGPGLGDWKEEVRTGKTRYEFFREPDGNGCLKATSVKTASLLARRLQYDAKQYPYLKWRWKMEKMTPVADMRSVGGSDAPGRVYVAFASGFGIFSTKLINYVWASSMPVDEVIRSVFSPSSRMLVLESGLGKSEGWVEEERNILEDYRRLFGEDPPPVVGIALMTDSDNTDSEAVAYYDDIVISTQPS